MVTQRVDQKHLASAVFMMMDFLIRAVVEIVLDLIADGLGLLLGFILRTGLMLMAAPIIPRLPLKR